MSKRITHLSFNTANRDFTKSDQYRYVWNVSSSVFRSVSGGFVPTVYPVENITSMRLSGIIMAPNLFSSNPDVDEPFLYCLIDEFKQQSFRVTTSNNRYHFPLRTYRVGINNGSFFDEWGAKNDGIYRFNYPIRVMPDTISISFNDGFNREIFPVITYPISSITSGSPTTVTLTGVNVSDIPDLANFVSGLNDYTVNIYGCVAENSADAALVSGLNSVTGHQITSGTFNDSITIAYDTSALAGNVNVENAYITINIISIIELTLSHYDEL